MRSRSAVLNIKLKHLDAWTAGRQRNARIYDSAFEAADLGKAVETPRAVPGLRHIFNQYVIRVRDRDKLRQHLMAAGVGTEIYYPVPLHLQECFAYLKHRKGDFPQSERAAEETLALPIFPGADGSAAALRRSDVSRTSTDAKGSTHG